MIIEEFHTPGLVCRSHVLQAPLDHYRPGGEKIELFAREVARPDRDRDDLPWLVYLQGGPGHKADRPSLELTWLERALGEYRVLLLDQRGTGRSTPANRQTLAGRGSPTAQADYLTHFRADSIVRDAELFRREVAGPEASWSVLGQSFGGFCAVTYLSFAPEHLREVLITGGLPGLQATADDVYRAAYPRVRAKNEQFLARYPGDGPLLRRIVEVLRKQHVVLPGGDHLTPHRFQTVGIELGMAARFDQLHYLLEEAFVTDNELSDTFLRGVDAIVSFAAHPLFALMHEPIYCQRGASRWAAERIRAEFPEFDAFGAGDVPLLTGEMIYPWQFSEDPSLQPLRSVANLLAERADWPALYDPARLAANKVPVVAVVYHDDMYVDRDMSLATARTIKNLRVWVTNEFEHDGVRLDARVFDRLLQMVRGNA